MKSPKCMKDTQKTRAFLYKVRETIDHGFLSFVNSSEEFDESGIKWSKLFVQGFIALSYRALDDGLHIIGYAGGFWVDIECDDAVASSLTPVPRTHVPHYTIEFINVTFSPFYFCEYDTVHNCTNVPSV